MKYLLTCIVSLVVAAYGYSASVFVDRIRCVKSSDSADDIYIIVFRGQMTAPFNSNVGIIGPGNFWRDFDDGEPWDEDIGLASFSPDAVYVVLLMEQDSGNDSNNPEDLRRWRNLTDVTWKVTRGAQTAAGLPINEATRTAAANAVVNSFETARAATQILEDPDDEMGPPRRLVVSPAAMKTMEFNEVPPDGRYRVRFMVK